MKKGTISFNGSLKETGKKGVYIATLDGSKTVIHIHDSHPEESKKPVKPEPSGLIPIEIGAKAVVVTEGVGKHAHYYKKGTKVEFIGYDKFDTLVLSYHFMEIGKQRTQYLQAKDFRLLPAKKAAKKKVKK